MSLESFKEKLENLRGEYTFDFANEDDCAYFLEEHGGEEYLKKEFPRIYDTFLRTRECARIRANDQTNEASEVNICEGQLGKLQINTEFNSAEQQNASDPYIVLEAPLSCAFIDQTKKVCSNEAASPWQGVTVETKIKEQFSPNYLIQTSEVLTSTNSFAGMISSEPVKMSAVNNKRFITTIELSGKDPKGNYHKKIYQESQDIGDGKQYTIADIKITDPAPQTSDHKAKNIIMMLYGRLDQQEIYKEADYKGGDFLNNVFADGKVHLLIPMTGEVTFDYNVQPLGLLYSKVEGFTRSTATYDYLQQVFTYRSDIPPTNDEYLYNRLKDKFTTDGYSSFSRSKMKFDISIEEPLRSKYDWHCDVEGVQNGEPKTIMLNGAFTYKVKNQLGKEVGEQIMIQSATSADLLELKREYFQFKPKSNTIYIPPITIYWGCFGKNVRIMLADGSERNACDIQIGDRIRGQEGEILSVSNVMKGLEYEIFRIGTADGDIEVSGGHPMLCAGVMKRAAELKKGDKLSREDGSQSEITSVDVIPYNDTVYNYIFEGIEEGKYILANGFWSGDLYNQNTRKEKPEYILSQEELDFVEEMKRLHNMKQTT